MPLPPLVEPVDALSPAEAARTARHAVLYPLGELGQRRLAAAHVAIVGAGGLGSPAVLALAAAGVGRITIVDDDDVEASNLQRQILHRFADLGAPKVDSAVRTAADLAPECVVVPVRERIDAGNAGRILAGADVVLDGSDSFATREAVAHACEELGTPLVWGVVQEFHAQVTVFWSAPPAGAPAIRLEDLHPAGSAGNVPTCAEVGVLGALVMQVGSLMASQAILLIAGIGHPLLGRVALVDGLRSTTREVPLRPAPEGHRIRERTSDPVSSHEDDVPSVSDDALYLDVRNDDEVASGMIPGARHVPLPRLLADPASVAASLADERRAIVAVCASGMRSARAARILADHGVRATSFDGGMSAWTGDVEVPA